LTLTLHPLDRCKRREVLSGDAPDCEPTARGLTTKAGNRHAAIWKGDLRRNREAQQRVGRKLASLNRGVHARIFA
jgi:hypothetical protein